MSHLLKIAVSFAIALFVTSFMEWIEWSINTQVDYLTLSLLTFLLFIYVFDFYEK